MTGNNGHDPKDPCWNSTHYKNFLPSCGGDCPRNCPVPVGGCGKVSIKPSCPAVRAERSRNQPCGIEHLVSRVPQSSMSFGKSRLGSRQIGLRTGEQANHP